MVMEMIVISSVILIIMVIVYALRQDKKDCEVNLELKAIGFKFNFKTNNTLKNDKNKKNAPSNPKR